MEVKDMDTQTENKPEVKEKETQTPKVKKCFSTKDFKTNEVNICILKRAVCSDDEWQEYE